MEDGFMQNREFTLTYKLLLMTVSLFFLATASMSAEMKTVVVDAPQDKAEKAMQCSNGENKIIFQFNGWYQFPGKKDLSAIITEKVSFTGVAEYKKDEIHAKITDPVKFWDKKLGKHKKNQTITIAVPGYKSLER